MNREPESPSENEHTSSAGVCYAACVTTRQLLVAPGNDTLPARLTHAG